MPRFACPRCGGSKNAFAFGAIYKEGHSGPSSMIVPCNLCSGEGYVSGQRLALICRGQKFQEYRENLQLGLREAAVAWGMSPSELSHIEQGRVATDWKPPGFEDYKGNWSKTE